MSKKVPKAKIVTMISSRFNELKHCRRLNNMANGSLELEGEQKTLFSQIQDELLPSSMSVCRVNHRLGDPQEAMRGSEDAGGG